MIVVAQLVFHDVAFAYEGGAEIFRDLSVHFPLGWSGIVGRNGAGKTTLLQLATGLLPPSHGSVTRRGHAVYCAQRTDDPPDELARFTADRHALAAVLRRRLRLDQGLLGRWSTLSHGERKRLQLAVALWLDPEVLALDEPTNHLDEGTAHVIARTLRSFGGVGLLVSHDRALLDALCQQCVFVHEGGAVTRPGGYSAAAEQQRRDQDAARRDRELASAELKRLRREQQARRAKADQARSQRSGRRLARNDSDARARRQQAILTGKDGRAGRLLAQMQRRVERAREAAASVHVEKVDRVDIWMPGACSHRRAVTSLDGGELHLGGGKRLVHLGLIVGPKDRTALTGPNGAGKSTLVRELVARADLPAGRLVYLPQEIPADTALSCLDEIGRLDDDTLGRLLAVYGRLGSRPDRLLESRLPSPGETRKLLLALGVAHEPHLIVMDEPTNHLDLPAIEALENALAECPCALVLVSHDRRFLERLCATEWRFVVETDALVRLETRALVSSGDRVE